MFDPMGGVSLSQEKNRCQAIVTVPTVSVPLPAENSSPLSFLVDEPVNQGQNKSMNASVVALDSSSSLAEPPTTGEPLKLFNPSPYQESIRDFVLGDTRNLRIEAYAGSGKTVTNAWVCGFIPEDSISVKQMVFAKANQLDMQKKIPEWIPATTTHAAGRADIIRAFGHVEIDERKVWNLLRSTFEFDNEVRDNAPSIVKLVSLLKNTLRLPTKDNLDYLTDRFNVEMNGAVDTVYHATTRLYQLSLEQRRIIDFDDMLFYPASGLVPVEKCDLLFVDEYQDNNDAQEAYYLKTGARIIFVGDARQAIFGFRGAMIGAMDKMQCLLTAEQLPLPISYRCAKAIIARAQTIVPGIQARPDAVDGIVRNVDSLSNLKPGDMVLCRNNTPLVKPCYNLIRQGIKATIKGRDIGKNLVQFLNKVDRRFQSSDYRRLLMDMTQYVEREAGKLDELGKESQAAKLRDDRDTIIALSDGVYSISDLETRIKTIFADDTPGIVFSTAHRSKGLESDRIFIIEPQLLEPQKYDKATWQLEQLRNLRYVCITRAKSELNFVYSKE